MRENRTKKTREEKKADKLALACAKTGGFDKVTYLHDWRGHRAYEMGYSNYDGPLCIGLHYILVKDDTARWVYGEEAHTILSERCEELDGLARTCFANNGYGEEGELECSVDWNGYEVYNLFREDGELLTQDIALVDGKTMQARMATAEELAQMEKDLENDCE